MASPKPPTSLTSILLCIFLALASSNQAAGFRITLEHVDSGKKLDKFELIKRAIERGKNRFEMLNERTRNSRGFSAPVYADNGEYLMRLGIGTPELSFSAIMDTGSDLIWTQCLPCAPCFNQSTPIYNPMKSSSFSEITSCSNKFCQALPLLICSQSCNYVYSYGDSSSTQGYLATEKFTFGSVPLRDVAFGCGLDNPGFGVNGEAGLIGLGRGPLSLVSQLDIPKFSYCLTPFTSTESSTLLMGSSADKLRSGRRRTAKLEKNPQNPSFYYVTLRAISVGGTFLKIHPSSLALKEDGTGGMIVDSGTTLTYLTNEAYGLLKDELKKRIKLTRVDEYEATGLDLCYKTPRGGSGLEFPRLVFHFEGTILDLPTENYMVEMLPGVVCLAMAGSSGLSIFGNLQQQNTLLAYDLRKEELTFIRAKCDEL